MGLYAFTTVVLGLVCFLLGRRLGRHDMRRKYDKAYQEEQHQLRLARYADEHRRQFEALGGGGEL